jgi:hypothetical protein
MVMKKVVSRNDFDETFKKYSGGEMSICDISRSLQRVAFVVEKPDLENLLYVFVIGCTYLCLPIIQNNVSLTLSTEIDEYEQQISSLLDRNNNNQPIVSTRGGIQFVLASKESTDFKYDTSWGNDLEGPN